SLSHKLSRRISTLSLSRHNRVSHSSHSRRLTPTALSMLHHRLSRTPTSIHGPVNQLRVASPTTNDVSHHHQPIRVTVYVLLWVFLHLLLFFNHTPITDTHKELTLWTPQYLRALIRVLLSLVFITTVSLNISVVMQNGVSLTQMLDPLMFQHYFKAVVFSVLVKTN